MREINNTEELQTIVLSIAKEFHKIMTRNSIPYYLAGGGLLGAIRHRGFIPWDDDLDFSVPRKYFKRMKQVLKKELPEYYQIITIDNCRGLYAEILKIEDTRTLIKEIDNPNPHGVFIDIFPVDFTSKNGISHIRENIIWSIMAVYVLSLSKRRTLKNLICRFISKLFGKDWLIHSIKYIVSSHGDEITCYSGAYGKRETVPVSFIGNPTLYQFEDTQLFGVEHYDVYLKHIYGEYMELPPMENRRTHIVEMYYK